MLDNSIEITKEELVICMKALDWAQEAVDNDIVAMKDLGRNRSVKALEALNKSFKKVEDSLRFYTG